MNLLNESLCASSDRDQTCTGLSYFKRMGKSNKGWISIHRELKDHWLWEKNRVFSQAEAWIDLLISATHDDQKVKIGLQIYEVKRGDQVRSLKTLSEEWNWSRSKVKRFLELLQKENMVRLKSDTQTTQISICNYDTYQKERNANETLANIKRTSNEHQTNTDNNVNNDNNVNKIYSEPKNFPTIEQCRQVAQMSGHDVSYGERYFYMRDATDWLVPRGKDSKLFPINNWRSDYINCYNQGYLKKTEKKTDEPKVVKGGLFT